MISCCRFSEDKDLRAAVSNPSTRAASPPPASTASPFADRLVNSGRVDDEEEVEKPAYCPICHVKFAIAATTSQVNAHVDRCLVPDKATDAFLWAESFDLINAPYYFGLVSREDAEGILNRCPVDSFLVRKSATNGGCFAVSTISTKPPRTFTHALVEPRSFNGGFAFQGSSIVYKSIPDLVTKSLEIRGFRPATKTPAH